MSAQQIKSNIKDLVNRIEDEDKLNACFNAFTAIVKGNRRQPTTIITNTTKPPTDTKINTMRIRLKAKKNVVPHDLSLAVLANDIFKDSEPLSEVGEIAFEKAFKKSLKKEPSLPNRL